MVYPRTNKQNQKKKRKVEAATSQVLDTKSNLYLQILFCLFLSLLTGSRIRVQEPGPAKVAVTGSGIPEAETVPDSSSIIWQEELSHREADTAAAWPKADLPPGTPLTHAGKLDIGRNFVFEDKIGPINKQQRLIVKIKKNFNICFV